VIGVHLCRIAGRLQEPLRSSVEVSPGLVVHCQFRRNSRRVGLVQFGETVGNQPAPFSSPGRRHCGLEGFLIQHVDEGIALAGNGISGIAFANGA
jgi:hypothetical protein